MTENMKTALMAINKFMYYSWNYPLVYHEWKTDGDIIRKETVPEFLVQVRWHCNFEHMLSKWRESIKSDNPMTYFPEFYSRLDLWNRKLFLEWIMENYNDERKLEL